MDADVGQVERGPVDVRDWRYDEARRAGLTPVEASLFAESDRDLAELRKLVKAGCPVEQLRAIVL